MKARPATTVQRSPADPVMGPIHGGHRAQKLVHQLRKGCAAPDALLDAVLEIQALGDEDILRGWAREIQKLIERTA